MIPHLMVLMAISFSQAQPFFNQIHVNHLHQQTKNESLTMASILI